MGCDIHLRVEMRKKVNPDSQYKYDWHNVGFKGEFRSRVYGMFARMANVRSYGDNYKVQFEPRGLPDDITDWATRKSFYLHVTDDKAAADWGYQYCLKEMAEKWVEDGYF